MLTHNPNPHPRRKSLRLKNYDYTSPGAYFVTICTWRRQCLLSEIVDGESQLTRFGELVLSTWNNLPKLYPHVVLDTFMIMPNHLHGIIVLTEKQIQGKKRHGLPEIVRGLKTFSARNINRMRQMTGVSLWQRGYYEHIIRNEIALEKIREYIANNPQTWEEDTIHPNHPEFSKLKKIYVDLDNTTKLAMDLCQ